MLLCSLVLKARKGTLYGGLLSREYFPPVAHCETHVNSLVASALEVDLEMHRRAFLRIISISWEILGYWGVVFPERA